MKKIIGTAAERKENRKGRRPAPDRMPGTYHEKERHKDAADNDGTTEGVRCQRGKNGHHDGDVTELGVPRSQDAEVDDVSATSVRHQLPADVFTPTS